MTVREVDAEGTLWRIWPVVPTASLGGPGQHMTGGWLAMENERGEKRRVFPVPPGWEHWSDERLRLTIRMAGSRHTLPSTDPPLPG